MCFSNTEPNSLVPPRTLSEVTGWASGRGSDRRSRFSPSCLLVIWSRFVRRARLEAEESRPAPNTGSFTAHVPEAGEIAQPRSPAVRMVVPTVPVAAGPACHRLGRSALSAGTDAASAPTSAGRHAASVAGPGRPAMPSGSSDQFGTEKLRPPHRVRRSAAASRSEEVRFLL